jgi:hypothetical protein
MSIYFKFSVGRSGTSGANARYITREPATKGDERAVFAHNYPEYAHEGNSYKEQRENIIEYAHQQEEDELQRPRRGTGEAQTHYRAVASFEGKVDTEQARQMGQEYLEKQFPNARTVGVVHQDTNHTHVHFHIQARDIDGKKLRFERDQWKQLDREWARIYGCEFGRHQEREHFQKKVETREWKRSKMRGEQRSRPDRVRRGDRDQYGSREGRNAGREFIESRTGRDQRTVADGINRAEGREGSAFSGQQQAAPGERAISEHSDASQRVDQQLGRTKSEARGTLQETEGVHSKLEELGERSREEIIRDRDHDRIR